MTQQHPITPPPELIQRWSEQFEAGRSLYAMFEDIYRAGADVELQACGEWLMLNGYGAVISRLRIDRRPKPPSLKEQALLAVDTAVADYRIAADVADVVRRALEQLPDNE
jgi:hypothetical protein